MTTTTTFNAIFTTVIISMVATSIQAGSCWMKNDNGLCRNLITFGENVQHEDCCKDGNPNTGFNEENLSRSQQWDLFLGLPLTVKCSPCYQNCSKVSCLKGQQCQMVDGAPKCVCKTDCSDIKYHGPVCAHHAEKGFVTYTSICAMKKDSCANRREINVMYHGVCRESCEFIRCGPKEMCYPKSRYMSKPTCISCAINPKCVRDPATDTHVCGTDGRTYANECVLRKAICRRGVEVNIAYKGKCHRSNTCQNIQCHDGKVCLTDATTNRPRCSSCTNVPCNSSIDHQVCGTDGKTYKNWCVMHQQACSSRKVIDLYHSGPCKENSALYEALKDSLRSDERKTADNANGNNVVVSDTTPLPAPITAGGIQDDE